MGQTSPSSWLRRAATGCGALVLIVAVGLVVLILVDPLCDNHVVADVVSPDGQRHAVVVRRDCGVTNGHSMQVSVLPRWRSGARYGGNVFAADGALVPAPDGPGGQPRIAVRWLDSRTLEVHYDRRARVLSKSDPLDDPTEVRFMADSM